MTHEAAHLGYHADRRTLGIMPDCLVPGECRGRLCNMLNKPRLTDFAIRQYEIVISANEQ